MWRVVCSLGGDTGYFYMNGLWWLRAFADWMIGGRGLTRGRRHPTELRLGDRIDCWTVLGIEHEQRLTLQFGMRAPGSGVLELDIAPVPQPIPLATQPDSQGQPPAAASCRVTVTAYWHPQGLWGLLYWYAMVPAHLFIFMGMTTRMARRAEALEQRASEGDHPT